MKKLITLMFVLMAYSTVSFAQTKNEAEFHFKTFIELMNFKSMGKSLDYYVDYASKAGLSKIYEEKDGRELYYVWADGVTYKKGHMTETYKKEGDAPKCLNVDLIESGNGVYSPMTITLIFPDKKAQQNFRQEGLNMGCVNEKKIYATDVDPTWKNVSCIKYVKHRLNTSWRYIFFYEKDGMNMCTFLF